jgi:hypothetical protein
LIYSYDLKKILLNNFLKSFRASSIQWK